MLNIYVCLRVSCIVHTSQHSIPAWKYVALRDVETSVNDNHNVTSCIQQPPLQHKVQHTSLSVLAATRNPVQIPLPSFITLNKSDTWSQMRSFSRANSLASGEAALASHMSISHSELPILQWKEPLCGTLQSSRGAAFAHITTFVRWE